jgi:hypothetical protein
MINIEALTKNTKYITYGLYAIIIVVLLLLVFYIFTKVTLDKRNCVALNKLYPDFPPLKSASTDIDNEKYKLRDYYIKTAYNCCASGEFKNDYVNVCALKKCIEQGYRCLDFEIYNINKYPVIAVSPTNNFYTKGSYNSLSFNNAMLAINNVAFASGTCPNANDPLILHFRIKSEQNEIYDSMFDTLSKTFKNRLLGENYGNENNGNNLGDLSLSTFYGKVVIIVDRSNPGFEKTKLNKLVNLASNSMFMRATRNYDVVYTHQFQELINFNKKNMTLSMPDLSARNSNLNPAIHMKYGVQFIGMNNQNDDTNLQFYNQVFNSDNTAFVLKPAELRYIPVTIKAPKPQNPALSYAERNVSTDYYKFNI